MNWLESITGKKAQEIAPKAQAHPLDELLGQVAIAIGASDTNAASATSTDELDEFAAMLAGIGKATNSTGATNDLNLSFNAMRPRVYGGPELYLVQDEFEELHEIADSGHSELVKLPRNLLVKLLMDHSRLINKLYKN